MSVSASAVPIWRHETPGNEHLSLSLYVSICMYVKYVYIYTVIIYNMCIYIHIYGIYNSMCIYIYVCVSVSGYVHVYVHVCVVDWDGHETLLSFPQPAKHLRRSDWDHETQRWFSLKQNGLAGRPVQGKKMGKVTLIYSLCDSRKVVFHFKNVSSS